MTKIDEGKYLTLKEAAQISGYAPDYIGQLIRKGKLEGKQVYFNVAWVTTEDALKKYMARDNGDSDNAGVHGLFSKLGEWRRRFVLELQMMRLMKSVLYVAIGFASLIILVLFYVFSVALDAKFQERALRNIQKNNLQEIPEPSATGSVL